MREIDITDLVDNTEWEKDKNKFYFLLIESLILQDSLFSDDFKIYVEFFSFLDSDFLLPNQDNSSNSLNLINSKILIKLYKSNKDATLEIFFSIITDPDKFEERVSLYQSIYPEFAKEILYFLNNKLNSGNLLDILTKNSFESILSLKNSYPEVISQDGEIKKFYQELEIYFRLYSIQLPEIIASRDQIKEILRTVENPEKTLNEIIKIFEIDTIPAFVKKFLVFKLLFKNRLIQSSYTNLIDSPALQLLLKNSNYNRVYNLLFRDMLKTSLYSGEPSLLYFVKKIEGLKPALDSREDFGNLVISNLKEFDVILQQIYILQSETLIFKRRLSANREDKILTVDEFVDLTTERKYSYIKSLFGDKTIYQRLVDLYLTPLGINSFSEALKCYNNRLQQANQKNTESASSPEKSTSCYVKKIDSRYFESVLNNGILCKEMLGNERAIHHDSTPLDTDTILIKWESTEPVSRELSSYGDLMIVFIDRGQFKTTKKDDYSDQKSYLPWKEKYEVFLSGKVAKNHYGIRTCIDCLEIDYLVIDDLSNIEPLKYFLAKKGLYIPILNKKKKLLFSTEEWESYKRIFAGTEFSSLDLEVKINQTELPLKVAKTLDKILEEKELEDSVLQKSSAVKQIINQVLDVCNIKIRDTEEIEVYGAEVIDTGSTGRGTNKSQGYDLDLAILLDNDTYSKKCVNLLQKLNEAFKQSDSVEIHNNTIRIYGFRLEQDTKIDIDISLMPKTVTVAIMSSDEAIKQKFDNISRTYGEVTLKQVKKQIILAKTVLAEFNCYKPIEHGSIGGIGVENWILSNKGCFYTACKSFLEHSKISDSLAEFKKNYALYCINAGINLRSLGRENSQRYENFLHKLTPKGYENFIQMASYIVNLQN